MSLPCQNCDACCCRTTSRMVNLAETDIARLAKHFGKTEEDFLEDGVLELIPGRPMLQRDENGDCVYIRGNKCGVYQARPGECRKYGREMCEYEGFYAKAMRRKEALNGSV